MTKITPQQLLQSMHKYWKWIAKDALGFMAKSIFDGDIVSSCLFAMAVGMIATNSIYVWTGEFQ